VPAGHLSPAKKSYLPAECQIGYFYWEGPGIEKDLDKAFYRTKRAAEHGDRDGRYNLSSHIPHPFGTYLAGIIGWHFNPGCK
jgi:TPR repeat protein